MTAPARQEPRPPRIERRRWRRGAVSRLLTAPLPTAAIESRVGGMAARAARAWPWIALVLGIGLVAGLLWFVWTVRGPVIIARHRPEALCFALAQARYTPVMVVEPGAAVVRGRFSDQTPVALAVRDAMHFTDDMVIQESLQRVGDYEVASLWLRIPGGRGHWLVLAWMEASDLEMASFRFDSDETDLTPDEVLWGNRLKRELLVARNFRAGEVPVVRLRGEAPRRFGPKAAER